MLTNCRNCGAPIEKGRCQYCGTDYRGTYVTYEEYKMPQLHNETILPKRPPQMRMTMEQIKRLEEYINKVQKRFERLGINGS